MASDDDCLCPPLRWHEGDWTPCPALPSALGGEKMVCAVPRCERVTPQPAVGRNSNPLGRREVKCSAVDLDAPHLSRCGRGCAVRMTLSCGATWMAELLRALCGGIRFSVFLFFCVGKLWERMCAEE
ncbi:putative dispersed gene family protein 1 (DGF-1) [Trypanosoma cruzi]|nr:putative dispersed gene family protein 1 (DGF-1) [Trypanosoma cruzi]